MFARTVSLLLRVILVVTIFTAGASTASAGPLTQTTPPDIAVSPSSFTLTVQAGQGATRELSMSNVGGQSLSYSISVRGASTGGTAVRWQPLVFPSSRVEAGLREAVLASPQAQATFMVYLKEQANLSAAYGIGDWSARGWLVYAALWEAAQNSQTELLGRLESLLASGEVQAYRSFFIVNAVLVTAGMPTIDELAVRHDVAYIEGLQSYSIPEPIQGQGQAIQAVEWGVQKIRADRVWADLGVRGEGIVVASIDTGAMYNHNALTRQYRGAASGSHNYNWFDPGGAGTPFDNNGHGTHTMGTSVGDDGGSNQIGVAPAAQWIAAKGCASSSCSTEDLLASAEWVLAPYPVGGSPNQGDPSKRPQVVNNSWGGGGGDTWYLASVNAWRAADIFPSFAAGNSGPAPGSVNSPGDYAASFASAATDINDSIAIFSSRGPSSLTDETKPDISAPGVNVRSAWNNGSYNSISGTSMATPHTTGCVALIRSAARHLDVAAVESLLMSTAVDLPPAGPDFSHGNGRIDCFAAVSQAKATWLRVNPVSGGVDPNGSQTITVMVDATRLSPGSYAAEIVINSNDPDENPVTVPVKLTVTEATATQTPGTPPATATRTPTPVTLTPTRTFTPAPLTPTGTRTFTPAPPTPTATRTFTPAPLTPTGTRTFTPTPLVPTATRTHTPTATSPTPTSPPGLIFFDDFEAERGWRVNPDGGDGATTGQWQRADPEDSNYLLRRLQLGTTVSGVHDLVTGPLAGAGAGEHDVDNGRTSIRSPDIRLPSGGEITLSFFYYLAHLGNATSDDYLRVKVVGAATGVVLEELGSPDEDDAGWQSFSVRLNGFAGQTVFLLIEVADAGTPSLIEAAIDDVAIAATGAPTATPTARPTNTPAPTHTASPVIPTATPAPEEIFFDDFEAERGWKVNPDGGDGATTGQWQRADPEDSTYLLRRLQLGTTVSGVRDLVTGPLAGSGAGAHDVDNGRTSIRSPDIHLPASGEITLSFFYYLAHLSNATSDDYLRVKVVGATTAVVLEELGSPDEDDAGWQSFSVRLDGFAGQTVFLLIEVADAGSPSLIEAAFDDLRVSFKRP